MTKPVLVIGGGIAGIQAAVDLAEQGIKTYLVEKTPSIGGRMAQLDKTFPTLDCAACILTPKMVSAAKNENIELITYAEVQEIKGSAGNFAVRILKKPRYVEIEKCLGCGECIAKCPVSVQDEFNLGMSKRKAIYWPFPQAVPLVSTIDAEHCLYFTKGVCKVCQKFCPTEAINFTQEAQTVDLDVASIIVASGFQLQDASLIPEYGYRTHANVRTSLEFERLVSSTGPTGGEIVRASDKKRPQSIAFIQCVCSRDVRLNPNCSAFCCTASVKQAILAKEHLPGVDCTIFYMDLRAFGKGYQEFYDRAKQEFGIKFIRGRPAKIEEDAATKNLTLTYEDTSEARLKKMNVEMAVLAVGVKINPVESFLHAPLDDDGYIKLTNPYADPVSTAVDGIFAAGVVAGAKDIPDSVTQASAAAMRASIVAVREKT
jgi:heterodisulfide reductase subunit A